MRKKKVGFFWASYTDLMTSLFFVMLVVYVLTFLLLQREKKRLEIDAEKYNQIAAVEKAVENMEKDYFDYEEEYKRLILTRQIQFATNKSDISLRDKPYLKRVGQEIQQLINEKKKEDVRYLVIIEGMASKDSKASDQYNYELSYKRAYALFKYWKNEAKLDFNDQINEIIIAGSGIGGVGREKIEKKNQRFLIQVIPKINAK